MQSGTTGVNAPVLSVPAQRQRNAKETHPRSGAHPKVYFDRALGHDTETGATCSSLSLSKMGSKQASPGGRQSKAKTPRCAVAATVAPDAAAAAAQDGSPCARARCWREGRQTGSVHEQCRGLLPLDNKNVPIKSHSAFQQATGSTHPAPAGSGAHGAHSRHTGSARAR